MSDNVRLVVKLEARVADLERNMRKAEQAGTKAYQNLSKGSRSATRQMEQDMVRSSRRVQQAVAATSGQIGALGRAFAGAFSAAAMAQMARRYVQIADAATAMRNSLQVAGLEGEELSRVYEQLFASAQRNSAPINSLVDLYSKLSLTQKELGVSSEDLIRFTDGIAVALKVGGTDAQAASGALLQLSQALGGGIVRAEEFNSILEGAPTIAQAVARGLKEAGGSVAELRKLVIEGKVSSAAWFHAFEVGSAELREQAESTQSTVGQSLTRIGNSLVTVVGEFDQASGASAHFARMIDDLASGLDRFDAAGFVDDIGDIADAFREAEAAAAGWLRQMANAEAFKDLVEAMGITEDGQIVNPETREAEQKIAALEKEIETLQARIELNTELGFDNTEALARLNEVRATLAALRAEAANLPRYVEGLRPDGSAIQSMSEGGTPITSYDPPPSSAEPVSIADYPAGGTGGGSGGGRKRKGGGGGRRASADDYQKEVETIRKRTAALETEAAVLAVVAASGKDYGDALEFARKKAELLTAAQEAGKAITPELEAEIDALADAYVQAGLAAEGAAERLDLIAEQSRAGKDALTDMFGSILDGSMSAKDAIAKLLMEIAKVQMTKALFSLPGMGSIASGIGSLLVPGFASGGAHKGGLRIVGENGPELEATGPARIWNAQQTQNMLSGGGGSQAVDVNVTVGIDEKTGNLTAFVDKRVAGGVNMGINQYDRSLPDRVQQINQRPRMR